MSTQNPVILMSSRGIFWREYFFSTLQVSTFTMGSTCNYLVSYEQYDVISYEYVLCFFSTNNKCLRVLHKLICVNQFLTACFSSYKYVTAIRDAAGKVYVVTKRVQPRFVAFGSIDVCPTNSHRSRCFSVPFRDEFMNVTSYSCALAHN